MTNWETITLTAAVTLIGGTILFGISEFIKVLVLVPLQRFREHVQLVLDRTDFYANRITNYFPTNPSDRDKQLMEQITADFRSAATGLSSTYVSISFHKTLVKFHIIPSPEKIHKAYGALMYLSNSILIRGQDNEVDTPTNNNKQIEIIKVALTPSNIK
jgi:hypothetical protein